MMCWTWVSAVRAEITSLAAMSRLDRPRAINAATSRSRAVSRAGSGQARAGFAAPAGSPKAMATAREGGIAWARSRDGALRLATCPMP